MSADDYGRHIEATDADMGSDFILRPREDGQGSDLLIIGVVNSPGGCSESNELQPSGVVTLSEVSPPSEERWGRGVKGDVVSFLDSQKPGSHGCASGCSGSYPAAVVLESGSGGYPAQTCTKTTDACSEGYLAGAHGAAAASLLNHALTHKPTAPQMRFVHAGQTAQPSQVCGRVLATDQELW